MSFLEKLFGDPNARTIKKLEPLVERINAFEVSFVALSNEELHNKTQEFRDRLAGGENLDALLPEAFAAVREAAKRTLGQRHFDVQLMGGAVLHHGEIAEMKTGEGKTLTATLPVYLNALTGRGVHLVTVNDYLARRDTVWMGQIYHALGLSVGCIQHESAFWYDSTYKHPELTQEGAVGDEERDTTGSFRVQEDYLRPVSRQEAYAADITYGTNNEFGFDYLRDNMAHAFDQMVQRPLHYAIVDEVDSILIDEARTPLIISAPAEESTDLYYRFAELVKRLQVNVDYNVDEKMRAATFTEVGQDKITQWLGSDPWTSLDAQTIYHLEAALKADALYHREKEYVVKDNEVIIVDEFTGRLMHGRRYSEGLHQAIEAKEGAPIQRESKTLATVTFQNYFRLYEKLAGMTGTALTEAEEFSRIYGLEVTVVPTNKPLVRKDLSDRVYATESGKLRAVAKEIKERQAAGQPMLVGTISVEKNEKLGELLAREGVRHEILNAKNHAREAEIIAQAGRRGAVTVATNMAGRGVDIILGGNPPDEREAAQVRELGGLYVLGTERHESRRIDNQLRGRAGRQGDPGATQFYVSMEDDLMRIFGPERMKNMMQKLGLPEDQPIEHGMVTKAIATAQKKVEGHNFDIRKHLLEYDDVLNKHREVFYRERRAVLEAAVQDFPVSPGGGDQGGVEGLAALTNLIFEYVEQEIEQVVLFHAAGDDQKDWNLNEIVEVVRTIFPLPTGGEDAILSVRREAGGKLADAEARTSLIENISGMARAAYDAQLEQIGDPRLVRDILKGFVLQAMDIMWIEHLDAMHHLRTGIGLRGYGQRDPLVEYKKESYRLFNEFLAGIQKRVVYTIFRAGAVAQQHRGLLDRRGLRLSAPQKDSSSSSVRGEGGGLPGKAQPKVGRNDPCPCGAKNTDGTPKKFKKCHGA